MNLTFLDRLLQGFKNITVSSYMNEDFEIYLKDVIRIDFVDYWEKSVGCDLTKGKYIKLITGKSTYILSKDFEDNYLHILESDFNNLLEIYTDKILNKQIHH
jgi:hypothetical protein